MTPRHIFYAFIGILSLVLLTNSLFVVDAREQVLVLAFGKPVRVVQTPGLQAKIPFLQQTQSFDKRILNLDPPDEKVILADQKRLDVDTYARYRIEDPLKFRRATGGTGAPTEEAANRRLGNFINSSLRKVLGNITLQDMLSEQRDVIMANIQKEVSQAARSFGIEVIDVRIRRADYPAEASQKVYERMRREREREAEQLRAIGVQESRTITARADFEKASILADAERKSSITRGEAEAEAIKTYANAFERDASFYSFYRTLQAYRTALENGEEVQFVLSPDSDFLGLLQDYKQP